MSDDAFLNEEQRRGYEEQTKGNPKCPLCDHPMLDASEWLKSDAKEAYICHPCGTAFLRRTKEEPFTAIPARCRTIQ